MTQIRPPAEMRPIVDAIGTQAALRLLDAFAGIRLAVPARARAQSPLTKAVGPEAAAALASAFGGTQLYVPLAKRWRILHLRQEGLSYVAIARKLNVSEATVHQALADHGMTRQLSLLL